MMLPLVLAGLAMGVAATPHCLVMCASPCAALTHGCGRSAVSFHAARVAGYMAGGAVAAASMATLVAWAAASPALRPLWTLLHLSLGLLGLWWLVTGRHPTLLRGGPVAQPVSVHGTLATRRRWRRAGAAGLAWVAWPCAALHAALLLAAMADTALGGALVMGAFAVGSMPALGLAPWAWARWQAARQRVPHMPEVHRVQGVPDMPFAAGAAASLAAPGHARGGSSVLVTQAGGSGSSTLLAAQGGSAALGLRIAGIGLVLSSSWALGHGLWMRVAAWCGIG